MTTLDSSEPAITDPEHTGTGNGASYRSPTQGASLKLNTDRHGDFAVVSATGELNATTVGALTRLADTLTREGRPRIVLDASRLYDLDTTAINELSDLQLTLATQAGGLRLAAPRPWVRRLLERLCHRGTFLIDATVAEAVTQLQPDHSAVGEHERG